MLANVVKLVNTNQSIGLEGLKFLNALMDAYM